jgi:predicted AAA+ superfamily ATPase
MELIKRELEDKLKKFIERREIIGIRGARQTGKTTLLKMIEKQVEGEKAFIDLYLPDYRKTFEENPIDFVKRFKKEGKLFLFLDEVQKARDAGEKLKIIYDNFPDVKIFISGSSSLELKTKILPELVGRLFLFNLYTFNFYEFLLAKDESLAKIVKEKRESLRKFLEGNDDVSPPSFQEEILKYWKEYVVFGGYPEVVKAKSLEEKITILKSIFSLYVEKDVAGFFGITETSKFEDLVKVLAFNISNLISISSLSSELKISYDNVERYLEILKHTYIIYLLKPFFKNLTTEIKKASKIYFLDLGLRNCAIDNFLEFDKRVDKGELSENFVFREILSNFEEWKINFWRTTGKAEIDFIVRKNEKIFPIEVKLAGEKLGKGFYSFIKSYEPEKAIIVSLDGFEKKSANKTLVQKIPIYYL